MSTPPPEPEQTWAQAHTVPAVPKDPASGRAIGTPMAGLVYADHDPEAEAG